MNHLLNPRNMAEMQEPTMVGEATASGTGGTLRLMVKLDETQSRIVDASFVADRCDKAIASSSALTEILKGLTIEEATRIRDKDIVSYLGARDGERLHDSTLSFKALEKALEEFQGESLGYVDPPERIICVCHGVELSEIERVVREQGLTTIRMVARACRAGAGCTGCWPLLQEILGRMNSRGMSQWPSS